MYAISPYKNIKSTLIIQVAEPAFFKKNNMFFATTEIGIDYDFSLFGILEYQSCHIIENFVYFCMILPKTTKWL